MKIWETDVKVIINKLLVKSSLSHTFDYICVFDINSIISDKI